MRDDQADERDDAAEGDSDAGEQRGGDQQATADGAHVQAQVVRFLVAQQQRIQCAVLAQSPNEGEKQHYAGDGALSVVCAGEAAIQPVERALQRPLGEAQENERHHRRRQRAQRDAQQQQPQRRAPRVAQQADQQSSDRQTADEGGQRQRDDGSKHREGQGDQRNDRAQSRAGGHASDVGLRQRVAKKALHIHTGDREHTADGKCQQQTRQAKLPEDEREGGVGGIEARRAQHQRQRADGDQRQHED